MSDLQFAGTVKLWNAARAYGFIVRDGDYRDVFLHIAVLRKAGLIGLDVGSRVVFDVIEDQFGRLRADRIARVEP